MTSNSVRTVWICTVVILLAGSIRCQGIIYDSTGFESPTFDTGPITSQDGWTDSGDDSKIIVQDTRTFAGSQALQLKNDGNRLIARKVQDPGTDDYYIRFWLYPASAAEVVGNFSFYLRDSAGTIMFSVSFNSSGTINGTGGTAYEFGQWNQIDIHVKGASQEWDLWVNGVLTNVDLPFINSPGAGRHLGIFDFDWQGHAAYSGSTYGVFIDQFDVYVKDSGAIYDTCGFEPSSTFVVDPLGSQDGWASYGDSNSIVIQSNRVYDGAKALQLKNDGSRLIARKLQDPGTNDFFVALWLYPPDAEEIEGNLSIYLRDSAGTIMFVVSFNSSGTINGTGGTAYEFGQWNQVAMHVKRDSETWDLYVNGALTNEDLNFINSPGIGRHLGCLDLDWEGDPAYSQNTDGVFFDDIIISAPDAGDVYLSGGFESPTFTTGPITGQDGWTDSGDDSKISIQTTRTFDGSQALQLKNDGNRLIARKTQDPGTDDYYIDFWLYPASAVEIVGNFSFYLRDSAGTIMFAVSFNSSGTINNTGGTTYEFGQWNQVAIHVKGAAEKWDLWVNGVLTNVDLPFTNSPGAGRYLGMFDFDWQGNAAYSGSTYGVFVDDFEVTVPLYADQTAPGWNPDDATECLQNAIDTGARRVMLHDWPADASWIVRPLFLTASNQTLVFQDGVDVVAKAGEFHGTGDMLMMAYIEHDIVLSGYGATLRMHKDDYDGPGYTFSESRMATAFYGCDNVLIEGLTIKDSGGDCIYITGANATTTCSSNVVVRDVLCDNNYRQGISITSVDGLLLDNCVLANTSGTAPSAGVDFEPNGDNEQLTDIVVQDCDFLYNEGRGIQIGIYALTGDSQDVDILFDNCDVDAEGGTTDAVIVSSSTDGGVSGDITFQDCTFANGYGPGVHIQGMSGYPGGVTTTFDNCEVIDSAQGIYWPIYFNQTTTNGIARVGGVDFINGCKITDDQNRASLAASSTAKTQGLRDVHGTITVINPYGVSMDIGANGVDVDVSVVAP